MGVALTWESMRIEDINAYYDSVNKEEESAQYWSWASTMLHNWFENSFEYHVFNSKWNSSKDLNSNAK
jgi:hypothetical protein